MEMFHPDASELIRRKRHNYEQIAEFCRSPKAFLKHMDAACGIDRAVLINYVAPEVIGFTARRQSVDRRLRQGRTLHV